MNMPGLTFPVHQIKSPNFDARPEGVAVDLLVVHYISLPANVFRGNHVQDLFLNRLDLNAHHSFASLKGLRVSSHFFVRRSGKVIQFVDTNDRAWHAGESSFLGKERCNDFSIGVEMEGSGDQSFTASQYSRLVGLAKYLAQKHPLKYVAGHSDIAPYRKQDPGPCFDWSHFLSNIASTGLTKPF
jgi:N-acetyl-anhydromuramoyl-L-alanine amidase